MSVKIVYKSSQSKKNLSNLVLFVDEKFNISNLKKYISSKEYSIMSDLFKAKDLKKKILTFDINSKRKIILISLKKDLTSTEAENIGAKFYDYFKNLIQNEYHINSDSIINKLENCVGYFLHGIKLKSYSFDKYKTKKIKKYLT